MFLVSITYRAPLHEVEATRPAHRAWLDELARRNLILVGGPVVDHSGGVVIMLHTTRADLDNDLAADPYLIDRLATHDVVEFEPRLRVIPSDDLGG